ncbi:MAG: carboxylating nicotinate-nucleotide diphosphorylase [Dehalococcoidia bacterium]|nr:carboxylating nicotinate-nucleotide diphosphorylase [Dehalococcoidia bacterium]
MLHITPEVQRLIDQALSEDQAFSDPTTDALIPPDLRGTGIIRAKARGVLAGVDLGLAVFSRVDPSLETRALLEDGSPLSPGDAAALVEGSASAILRAERPALNFIQRLSGIATDTSRYVGVVRGLRARIVDTRKTVPGLRYLEKYAVRAGGGANHRMNLADGILIKDNHIAAGRSRGVTLRETVERAVARAPHTIKVEVEVTNLEELEEVLDAGAHVILLDNMSPEEMSRAVKLVDGRAVLEASGGIDMETVRAVAETGVDLISVGALTHSPTALDLSLDLEFSQT